MGNILRKSEVTFALKVSLLLALVLVASSLKKDDTLDKEKYSVQNGGFSSIHTVFNNF